MELKITIEQTIQEIKKQFSKYFPGLKLEFYAAPHGQQESSADEKKISDDASPKKLKQLRKTGCFSYTPKTTVSEFEQRLQNEFGLPVQVFRKAGNRWIETTLTDPLTLEMQNAMALSTSRTERINLYSLFL